jgi:hypothetical protein
MRLDRQYSVSVSVQPGSYSTQISLSRPVPPTTTTALPLTSIFTPPPPCNTPFIECYGSSECDGYYLPVLLDLLNGEQDGDTIQCLPEITTSYDGYVDGVHGYSPGLFCPDGMTTEASIRGAFVCCPRYVPFLYTT